MSNGRLVKSFSDTTKPCNQKVPLNLFTREGVCLTHRSWENYSDIYSLKDQDKNLKRKKKKKRAMIF